MVSIRLAKNLSVASEKLLSYHVAISGMTGSGKSRNVSARLLRECLERRPEGPEGVRYAFIVIDTNSEYFPFQDEHPKQVIVFSPDASKGIPLRISSKNVSVDEISDFLREITKKEISKSEIAALFLAVDELRAKGDYTLEQVYEKLYELQSYSILPAYEKMMQTGIFGPFETPLSLLVRPGEASIVDIGGYSTEIQAIIFTHLARRLFHARTNKTVGPVIMFIEEASVFAPEGRLAPSSEIIKTVATQGRGYDFILVSIFQRSSLTDITLRSQTHNWIVGKTGNPLDRQAIMKAAERIEAEHDKIIKNLTVGREFLVTGLMVDEPKVVIIPDQKLLARKGGRIPQKAIDESFKREDLASYIEQVRRTEESERKRLDETITKLREEREARIKGPEIPKEAQQEIDKLKKSLEVAQKRYEEAIARADDHAKEKYAAKTKELEDSVERLTKQLTLKGVATETAWDHPLVQKRLREKLTAQQVSLVEFLEKGGPSLPEKIAAFLGCKPQNIPKYVSRLNKEIPDLVVRDSRSGAFRSRLQQIFPVTEAAKHESEELNQAKRRIAELEREQGSLRTTIESEEKKIAGLLSERDVLKKGIEDARHSDTGRDSSELRKQVEHLTNAAEAAKKQAADATETLRQIQHEKRGLEEQVRRLNEKLTKFASLESAIKATVGEVSHTPPGIETVRKIIKEELQNGTMGPAHLDDSHLQRLKNDILEELRKGGAGLAQGGRTLNVQDKITEIVVHEPTEPITAERSSLRGRIALLIAKYGFMNERHKLSEFVGELSNHSWIHDKSEVEKELLWFCDSGIMQRKISTGKMFWYSLVTGMEQRIRTVQE